MLCGVEGGGGLGSRSSRYSPLLSPSWASRGGPGLPPFQARMAQNLPGFALELFDFPQIHEAQILFMKLQILAMLINRHTYD